MRIKFTPKIINGLAVYLGISLKEIASSPEFPYSKIYLYKIAQGIAPINKNIDDYFNAMWNDFGLSNEDLNNIYQLSELLEAGAVQNKKYKNKMANCQGGVQNESK